MPQMARIAREPEMPNSLGLVTGSRPLDGGVGQKRTGLELRRFADSASAKLTSLGEGGCTCRLEEATVAVGDDPPQRMTVSDRQLWIDSAAWPQFRFRRHWVDPDLQRLLQHNGS